MNDSILFTVTLPTHITTVRKSKSLIHCWKYNNDFSKIDYQTFDSSDQDEATNYIISPFPSIQWAVFIDN